MKRAMSFIMCLAVVMGMTMTGCGTDDKIREAAEEAARLQASEDAANAALEAEEETTEAETEAETDEATEAETTEEATEETTEESDTDSDASTGSREIDENLINFDKMSFMINGYECILGETTLQDLIDAGVPFTENSLADANNNIQ